MEIDHCKNLEQVAEYLEDEGKGGQADKLRAAAAELARVTGQRDSLDIALRALMTQVQSRCGGRIVGDSKLVLAFQGADAALALCREPVEAACDEPAWNGDRCKLAKGHGGQHQGQKSTWGVLPQTLTSLPLTGSDDMGEDGRIVTNLTAEQTSGDKIVVDPHNHDDMGDGKEPSFLSKYLIEPTETPAPFVAADIGPIVRVDTVEDLIRMGNGLPFNSVPLDAPPPSGFIGGRYEIVSVTQPPPIIDHAETPERFDAGNAADQQL